MKASTTVEIVEGALDGLFVKVSWMRQDGGHTCPDGATARLESSAPSDDGAVTYPDPGNVRDAVHGTGQEFAEVDSDIPRPWPRHFLASPASNQQDTQCSCDTYIGSGSF